MTRWGGPRKWDIGFWPFAAGLLVLQFSLALWSSRFFFNSDSIFYIARRLQGLNDAWAVLFHYDDRGNFRPFTFWISSLLVPLFQ